MPSSQGKPLRRFLVGALLLSFGPSASISSPLPISLVPSGSAAETPGWHEGSLQHEGVARWFLTYVPENLPENPPVVVLLHGGTGGMYANFDTNAGAAREWPFLADREKFLLLVPNGINSDTGETYGSQQNWNDLRALGAERDSEADDVGFLDKLLDHAIDTHHVDSLRVYFTGGSNGGTMSYRFIMARAGRVAAAACYIANLPPDNLNFSTPARPVPILIGLGTNDPLMLYNGDPGKLRSAEETISWWVTTNNAGPPLTEIALPNPNTADNCQIYRREYPAGPGGASVVFLRNVGGGHASPSILHAIPQGSIALNLIGRQNRDLEAAVASWEFMSQFSAPFDPRLRIEQLDPISFSGRFESGYPSGTARLEANSTLSGPEAWIPLSALDLDPLGGVDFDDVTLPPELGTTRAFLRVVTEP